jgi:hypothetical protein
MKNGMPVSKTIENKQWTIISGVKTSFTFKLEKSPFRTTKYHSICNL